MPLSMSMSMSMPLTMSPQTPALVFEGVSHVYPSHGTHGLFMRGRFAKTRPQRQALKDISWQLTQGQCAGLVGVNGAGKTSLIRCALGLMTPTQGQVRVYGQAAGQAQARRRLAYLPERFLPPSWLRAQDYLQTLCRLYEHPYSVSQAVQHLAAMGLEADVLSRRLGQFSKGMTQKIAWLGAWLLQRDLWILDEPMSGLDALARQELRGQLRHLKNQGITCLMSTHAMEDVDTLCDHMVLLHQGCLRFAGKPAQFLEHMGQANMEQALLRCIQTPKSEQAWACESL